MNLLGAALYDPGTAASKATTLQRGDVDARRSGESFAQVASSTNKPANAFSARESLSTAAVVMVDIKRSAVQLDGYLTPGTFTALSRKQSIKNLAIDVVQPPRIRLPIAALSGSIQLWIVGSPFTFVFAFTLYIFNSILLVVFGSRMQLVPFSTMFSVRGAAQIASAFLVDIVRVSSVCCHSIIIHLCRGEYYTNRGKLWA